MFEIIPNWHPIFVHFTVALLSLAVALFVVTPFLKPPLQDQWRIVARWALWFGAGFAVLTGLAGWYAYNTVAHDTPSHAAMTEHRNWAIATIIVFLALAGWSAARVRRGRALGALFIVLMVFAGGLLASTAWHGGEVVYRYGLGVMSLPRTDAHEHGGAGHGESPGHAPAGEGTMEGHGHDDEHEGAGSMPPGTLPAGADPDGAHHRTADTDGHDDGHAH